MCAVLCPTYWTTFGIAEKNRNGSCPMHEWDHPYFFELLTPLPRPPGADGPHRRRGHVGRHCPYINIIWCGSVHALLRYRSKTAKMQKFLLTPIVTKISFPSFSARRGPPTPKLTCSRPWCLLYPEPKFHADRTILRWDILNRTKKQTKKQQT